MTSRLCSSSWSFQYATMTIWPVLMIEISWISWGYMTELLLNATCWWCTLLTVHLQTLSHANGMALWMAMMVCRSVWNMKCWIDLHIIWYNDAWCPEDESFYLWLPMMIAFCSCTTMRLTWLIRIHLWIYQLWWSLNFPSITIISSKFSFVRLKTTTIPSASAVLWLYC